MNLVREELSKARVHVGGTGRIGSGIVIALQAAGVGYVTCNDPQVVDEEQLESWPLAHRSDLGRPKVHVLERFLDGRGDFVIEPIIAPNQSPRVRPYLEQADLIISCANRLDARLHLERLAVQLKKSSLQAGVQDARDGFGGLISIWRPDMDYSCFGCLQVGRPHFRRGELLAPTVTGFVASLAAHLAVGLLDPRSTCAPPGSNLFAVDLKAFSFEAISVRPRRGCQVCDLDKAGRRR